MNAPRPAALSDEEVAEEVDKASYPLRPAAPSPPAWPTALLGSVSASLVASGATPLLAGGGFGAAVAVGAVGAIGTAGAVTAAVSVERRREIAGSAQAALERVAGPVHRFRARRWRGGLVGTPRIVRFRYQPAAVVANKTWPGIGAAALAAVLGARYRVSRHDPRLGRITLRMKPDPVMEKPSAELQRATGMMHQLFGQTALVEAKTAHETLQRISVQHECGVKATFPIWRERVERVVTTMLEGRWRARWDLRNDKVQFELRPRMESLVPRPAPSLDREHAHLIPLGVDEDGDVISWDLGSSMPHFLVCGKTGKGKSLATLTNIPTPAGWTTLEALKVGDRVFDDQGRPSTVTGVYDQPPGRECFEVIFSDGSTIVADAQHLWWTEDRATRTARWFQRLDRVRRTRLAPETVARARAAAAESPAADTITIPEAAEFLQIPPTSKRLHTIAATVGGPTLRTRVVDNPYRDQVITQKQTVRVYRAAETAAYLRLMADELLRLQPWQSQLQTLTLEHDVTVRELAERTGIPREMLRTILDRAPAVPSRLEQRAVQLHMPAKTVRRTFGTVRAFPKKQFLTALADDGKRCISDQRHRQSSGQVRATHEIRDTLITSTGHVNHSIPVAGPLELPVVDLPIGPYTLGAWLGDGHSWQACITSADPEIFEYIGAEGYLSHPHVLASDAFKACRTYQVSGLQTQLRALGLLKTDRAQPPTKRIPQQYLRASVAQRRALLAGLLDTDGTVSPQGTTQFTTTIPALADGVYELATSLGYRVSRVPGVARLNGRDCGPKWTLAFTTSDPVFRLQRKVAALKERTARHNPDKNNCRYIREIRPVAEVPMRCITVDSPSHLFLAGRAMIPTHNTVVLRGVAMELAARRLKVWLVDPKRVELIALRGWPNVQVVATTVEEQVVTILRAWDVMEERYAAIVEGASEDDFDLLVLVVDEFAEFSRRVSQWWSRIKVRGMPTICPVMEKFDSLVRLGRTAKIRVAIGVQRPDVRFFGESGESRDNFDSRLSLGRLSADGSRMMWGSSIGTSLPGIRGRAIACTSEDDAREIQTYWVPDPRRAETAPERDLLSQLRTPAAPKHPPLQITIPEPAIDSKGVPDVWGSIVEAVMEPVPDASAQPAQVTETPLEQPHDDDPTGDVRGSGETLDAEPDDTVTERSEMDDAAASGPSATVVAFPRGRTSRRSRSGSTPSAGTPMRPPTSDRTTVGPGDVAGDDPLADYGPPTTVSADEIEDGELFELDPDRWVVVESIEQDFLNEQEWVLAWRSVEPDSDASGTVLLPGDATVRCRAMNDEEQRP